MMRYPIPIPSVPKLTTQLDFQKADKSINMNKEENILHAIESLQLIGSLHMHSDVS